MDVQCERCKTEYEFDDALVSGRGTTVRCTHCGHQFKVRRSDTGEAEADRWVVETTIGHQLTFLTLRELQRAILAKQVARHDMLILNGAPPRPLREITELEPFFDGRASSRPPPAVANSVAYHPPAAPAVPMARTQSVDARPEEPVAVARPSPPAPALPREPVNGSAPEHGHAPLVTEGSMQASPARSVPPPPPAHVSPASPPAPEPRRSLPPPTDPVRHVSFDDIELQEALPSSSSDEAYDVPGRRRVGGWVVAFVLLLAVGVVGWVVAKPYLGARSAPAAPQLDGRAQTFLGEGEKAMADGDLETAQQAFDKASALAEHDPRVLLDEARVAGAKADIPWLKLRLLAADAAAESRTTKSLFDDRLARARRTADDALAAAPEDPAAARAKIDALRLADDRDGARTYVGKVTTLADQAETTYVLAALDLAEPSPLWATVIDRLRSAAGREGNAGRARAALVYALSKSGDLAAAKAELAKLDALTRSYPCSPNLHALIDQAPPKSSAERPATTANAPHANGVTPPSHPAMAPERSGAGSSDGVPGDQASAMQAASQAFKRADFGRARRIYEALVSRSPSDSEALSGIGDVARAQGDAAGAIAAYKRALAVNPSYLPALLGVADTEWANGDRANAQRAYKDITNRLPEGTYPSYVKTRADAVPATGAPTAGAGAKPYDPGDGI